MQLWRHLVDLRGYADRGMALSYRRLVLDTGIAERSLKRAMARLHAASMLDRVCTHIVRNDGFTSNLVVRVWGYYGTGEASTWVPKATIAWCESQENSWGGKRQCGTGVRLGTPGFVYAIWDPDALIVKIGFTTNFEQRLAGLRSYYQRDFDVLAVIPALSDEERRLHRLFRASWVKYGNQGKGVEWFYPTAEVREWLELVGASWPAWPKMEAISMSEIKDLDGQVGPSNISSNHSEHSSFSIEKEAAPAGADLFSGVAGVDPGTVPRVATGHPKLVGDPDDPNPRTRRAVRMAWLQLMVSAYNAAYQAVGLNGFLTLPGKRKEVEFATWDPTAGKDIASQTIEPTTKTGSTPGLLDPAVETWKYYPPLMDAARALQERNIAPHAWAAWAVERTRRQSKDGQPVQLPIAPHMVKRPTIQQKGGGLFMAAHIASNVHRAIFRQESGYGYGDGNVSLAPERVHYEQLFRASEYRRRLRGVCDFVAFPPWYTKLRQEEIAQGDEDPMIRYPATAKVAPR